MEPAVQEHREGPEQDLDAGHLERAPLHLAEAVRGARVQRPHRQGGPGSHTTGEAHVLLLIYCEHKENASSGGWQPSRSPLMGRATREQATNRSTLSLERPSSASERTRASVTSQNR